MLRRILQRRKVTHDEKVAKHADRLLYVKDGKVFGDKEE